MADSTCLNDNTSLTEMWKKYFGVWISPPDCVISWLNLSKLNVMYKNTRDKQLQNHQNHSKLLLLRPTSKSNEDFEGKSDSLSLNLSPKRLSQEDVFDSFVAQNYLELDQSKNDLENQVETKFHHFSGKRLFQDDTIDSQNAQSNFENDMSLFAFSATDPLGQQVSPEENRKQNA